MAEIICAEIVGTRMAEVGSGGYTVNSTSYSVLVFYDNGLCDLVEGSEREIRPYLPYMRPRDYKQLIPILEHFEQNIKQYVSSVIKQMNDEKNNPIPGGITGKRDTEAIKILTAAGFKTETEYATPGTTHGTVMQLTRKENELMTVILKIQYDVPDVRAMKQEEAVYKLQTAGFSVYTRNQILEGTETGTVIEVVPEPGTLNVTLIICDNGKLDESKFVDKMQKCSTIGEIWALWKTMNVFSKHHDVTELIEREKRTQEKYGKRTVTQVDSMKKTIQRMLLEEN